MPSKPVEIVTADDFVLKGVLFTPDVGKVSAHVQINCAMGIPSKFYHRFAQYLTIQGFSVLTWDYRLAGDSFPKDVNVKDKTAVIECLRNNQHISLFHHWARRDYAGALAYSLTREDKMPIVVLGHSIGGHMIPISDDPSLLARVSRFVLVSVDNAHFTYVSGKTMTKEQFLDFWRVTVPQSSKEKGYFDGTAFGLGGMLPLQAALDWAHCCANADSSAYIAAEVMLRHYYLGFDHPDCITIGFDDDEHMDDFGIAMMAMAMHYGTANFKSVFVRPKQLNWPSIGHVGVFRHEKGSELLRDAIQGKEIKAVQGLEVGHVQMAQDIPRARI